MKFGINAGFGDPLISELPNLASLLFTDVRQDLQYITDVDTLRARFAEFDHFPIQPLWIMRPEQLQYAPPGSRVELLNEPNLGNSRDAALWPVSPATYASLWNTYAPPALEREVVVFAGSISNLDQRGLAWLKQTWALMTPTPTHVSVHRYPENSGGAFKPHHGFSNRSEEVLALRDIIGNATLAVTEFGYHTGPRKRWFWPWCRYTDLQVYLHTVDEWEFWIEHGAESAYLYQLNDGVDDDPINRYGIRHTNGHWKPVAVAHWPFL